VFVDTDELNGPQNGRNCRVAKGLLGSEDGPCLVKLLCIPSSGLPSVDTVGEFDKCLHVHILSAFIARKLSVGLII
jgi:hypothetical protein